LYRGGLCTHTPIHGYTYTYTHIHIHAYTHPCINYTPLSTICIKPRSLPHKPIKNPLGGGGRQQRHPVQRVSPQGRALHRALLRETDTHTIPTGPHYLYTTYLIEPSLYDMCIQSPLSVLYYALNPYSFYRSAQNTTLPVRLPILLNPTLSMVQFVFNPLSLWCICVFNPLSLYYNTY
jgi:hypothetical protein